MIITIDGPTASGKSTVARLLAKKLAFFYINSGLFFRAVGYILINNYVYSLEDLYKPNENDIDEIMVPDRFVYSYDDKFQERIYFDQQDITPWLKNSYIDKAASVVSIHEFLREHLNNMQRRLAQNLNIVIDGRDSGTVVFPQAEIKIYLTATNQVRAQRWQQDQQRKGNKVEIDEALKIIQERDERDSSRECAPLRIAHDALVIDNSLLNKEETLERILTYAQRNNIQM